jgi:N-acetylneuraminate synthase/sialic acid synthase
MPREIIIDNHVINDSSDCYVIAEIGQNHQGSVKIAKELFDVIKECGANAVKIQKRDNASMFTRAALDRPYDNENSFGKTYGEHRAAVELSREQIAELQDYAQKIGLTMFSTAFDRKSADLLCELNMPAYKIASSDVDNLPLLRHVAAFGKPMIVSTGAATLDDVRRVYEEILPINPQLAILQCSAGYPPEYEELNLRVIPAYRAAFPEAVIGFSAHDNGIAMALAAYMLGSSVVEKHVTLNRAMKGSDHAFSLERSGLRRMVRDLHRARVALGDGVKCRYASEEATMTKMRKKLVAARPLSAGHRLTPDDVAIKVTPEGLPPYEWEKVIGQVLARPLAEDEKIQFGDLQPQ